MQSVGLQTVLGMSSTATQVQAVSQSGATVASEQAKETLDKQTELKKEEVQETQESDEVKIREEDQRRKEQERRESFFKNKSKGEPVEEIVAEQSQVGGGDTQGRLLNIKV